MRNIYARNKCDLFNKIATEVWEEIKFIHRAKIEASEIGITKSIIATIRNHRNYSPTAGIRVFANPGYDEANLGSDLDCFVEVAPNQYVWIAMQAKVLKKNKRYTTLNDGANNEPQWVKLRRLQNLTNCSAYLLLYNGLEGYEHIGQDQCGKYFIQDQFGCSLVSLETFEHYASIKGTNPTFKDIHLHDAQPWRILTCCTNFPRTNTYKFEEIEYSSKLIKNFKSERRNNLNISSNDHSKIVDAIKETEWNPQLRLVVNNFKKPPSEDYKS